ncbi:TlpA family protein disulfide reductase [Glycomyces sp. L485]|uniref:TlpA family protein disulfide reductase n=1 Tax=Glycomyces sp. L485 TaxID=2909235 RepID=UPI001F4AE392|nr:TlpA disulfide reductase family protein [Glycomyces sp. L485]MCH7231468.1 TlpA family protein disulfide reductase [Glycomyces sp. L485]
MKRTAIGIAATGLAAALAMSACGSDEEPTDEEPTSEEATAEETTDEAAPETAEEDKAVPELLDFTATTVDGEEFEGASLVGDPTVLWFWEHDCPICQSQGPAVADLYDEFGDRIDIVGVSGAGIYAASSADDREGFVEQTGTGDAFHIEDQDYELRNAFGIVSQSTFVVLDGEGEVVESGSLSEDDLNDAVEDLV